MDRHKEELRRIFEEARGFLDTPAATQARQEIERLHDDPGFKQIVEDMHRMENDPAVQQFGDDAERTWREVRAWEQAMLALGLPPLGEPPGTSD